MEYLNVCPDCGDLIDDHCVNCEQTELHEKAKTQLIKISDACPCLTTGDVLVYRNGDYFIASLDESDSDFYTGSVYWERECAPDDFYDGYNAEIRDDDMWMYLPEPINKESK